MPLPALSVLVSALISPMARAPIVAPSAEEISVSSALDTTIRMNRLEVSFELIFVTSSEVIF